MVNKMNVISFLHIYIHYIHKGRVCHKQFVAQFSMLLLGFTLLLDKRKKNFFFKSRASVTKKSFRGLLQMFLFFYITSFLLAKLFLLPTS